MPALYGNSPRLDPVRYIAKTCAGEELKLYSKSDYRKNGKNAEPLGEHELYELLERPVPTFPEIDGFTLRYLTFAYIDLVGECGWLKIREGRKIIALLPIMKSWIITKPTLGNHIYQIMPYGELGGITLNVLSEDFVFFKDVNLSDPYGNGKGMSESIADELEIDEYASKYQKNFFFNDATPPYVVTGYQGNEQGADRLKKTLKEKIGGFRKAREPAILTGQMDIKPLGINPKELDMVESRKFLRDECIQHYQLPPELFGIVENSNRATIDSSLYLAQKNVIAPRLKFFERVLNNQLLNEYDDLFCKHDLQILEDEDLQLRIYQFGVQNGCITREQFCEKFGINPEPKEGHYILPMSVNVIDASGEFKLDDIEPEETQTEDEIVIEDENGKSNLSITQKIINQKKEIDEWKMKAWKDFDEKAISKEPLFITAIKKIAKKQSGDILDRVKDLKEINDATINNLVNDYFVNSVDEAVKRGLAKAWLETMETGRENAKKIMSRKKELTTIDDITLTNEAFNQWVTKYGLVKAKEINETSKKKLLKAFRKALADGIENGMSIENLRKELQKESVNVFDELSNTRAYLIARTETGASMNIGQVATYKATGIEKKQWLATYDDRTRDTHLMMMDKIANIDETFEVERTDGGIDNMLYPLDPNGSAENVCNCRCTIIPVIE